MARRADSVVLKQCRGGAAILLAGLFATALALAQDRVGVYDFAYRLAGDARAKPVQVFDDGRDTFFQFHPGGPVPAIFADGPAGPRLLPPQSDGPYVKVAMVTNGFALRLGLGAATVTYLGIPRARDTAVPAGPAATEPVRRMPAAPSSSPPPLQLAASLPVSGLPRELLVPRSRPRITMEEGSYATPLKGDAIEWTATPEKVRLIDIGFARNSAVLTAAAARQVRSLVAEARPGSRFELTAVDDAASRQGLASSRVRAVEAALLAAGAAARNVVHRSASDGWEAGANPGAGVSLRMVDATTSAMQGLSSAPRPQQARTPPAVADTAYPSAASAASPVPQTWAVRKADGTLDRMLARWAKESGWTLVWQNGPAVAITGDTSLSRPDYIQAADYALEQAGVAGYRLRATAYSNQVLVVTGEE
jgi:hypothetical protein